MERFQVAGLTWHAVGGLAGGALTEGLSIS